MKTLSLQSILQRIVNVVDSGIHIINREGVTIVYNEKMAEIEGMIVKDVIGKTIPEVFQFNEETGSTMLNALNKGMVIQNSKQTYFNHHGQEITTITNTYPLYDDDNLTIIGAIEVAKDISHLERIIKNNILNKGNTRYTFDSIIGRSPNFVDVIEASKRVTRTTSSILIIGETGTGKELFAQSIHNGSNRSAQPFISQNCASLPESLIEGILFGTKKGAFTGSIERPGLFEQAEGGTLLLDEINSLSPNLQAKLLRALQEKTIRRVGDTKDKSIDVRIIATINEDPIEAITNNHLRKDLYYRLSVVSLFVPPLRNRKQDIELLSNHFINKFNQLFDMIVQPIGQDILSYFLHYDWPGNVRELEHIIEGMMNLLEQHELYITPNLLPYTLKQRNASKETVQTLPVKHAEPIKNDFLPLDTYMENVEKAYLKQVLDHHDNNISQSAKALQVSRQSLQYRLRKYNIK
ncbi:sigma-54 interaction domain-containing protein [Bacillus sp. JJ722]|uniref:sigma-54 interaction domain-containing protein n=1 Tax=Bacillus sp. JJ722 TaxID=3122973 RepID=UPI002FFEB267